MVEARDGDGPGREVGVVGAAHAHLREGEVRAVGEVERSRRGWVCAGVCGNGDGGGGGGGAGGAGGGGVLLMHCFCLVLSIVLDMVLS